jgi:hypothetical protein
VLRCSFSCDDVLEVSEEGELIVNGESIVPGSAGMPCAGLHVIQKWP